MRDKGETKKVSLKALKSVIRFEGCRFTKPVHGEGCRYPSGTCTDIQKQKSQ